MLITEMDPFSFDYYAGRCARFFDGDFGITTRLAEGKDEFKPQVIFIRNDGWSVCCNADQTQATDNLYPESWEKMIVRSPGKKERQ